MSFMIGRVDIASSSRQNSTVQFMNIYIMSLPPNCFFFMTVKRLANNALSIYRPLFSNMQPFSPIPLI